MKKIYIILALGLTSSLSFSQVQFEEVSAPGVALSSDTPYIVNSTDETPHADLRLVSTISSAADYKWRRVIISNPSGYGDQLCDDQTCFSCVGDPWERAAFYTIPGNGSTIFTPKLSTLGVGGSAHFKYYIVGNGDVLVDSIEVQFTSTVGLENEKELVSFSVYPNPANDIVNISIENAENTSISIFDIVGKEVANMNLVNGKNQLNIESLNAGVYFYSIRKNNEIIETKKLVVR